MRKRRGIDGGGGEFFICFTSRPSSSSSSAAVVGGGGSMRVPSTKSLMSPGRSSSSIPSLSLSSSLTRRLRSSGKGGQSPMFPAGGGAASVGGRKKRGCAFEAAEPSSPKVTCIGQVRVKSKKKKMQQQQAMMARSRSRGASFRRSRSSTSGLSSSQRGRGAEKACLPIGGTRNQRWMHQLPLSICEALKSLGCELNCFSSPCAGGRGERNRSGVCFSFSDADKRDKKSNGAIIADEGREVLRLVVKERETLNMGLLVRERGLLEMNHGEEEEREEEEEEEDMEATAAEEKEVVMDTEEVEKGRVSVCIPPKNALLLMRCRSDPVRMAALANKFWGSPVVKIQCEKEDDDDEAVAIGCKVDNDDRVHTHLQEKKEEDGEGNETEEFPDLPAEQVEEVDAGEKIHERVVSDAADLAQAIDKSTDFDEANEEMEKRQHMPTGCEQEEGSPAEAAIDEHVPSGEVIVPGSTCDKDAKSETRFVQREKEGEIKGRRRSTSSCSSTQSTEAAKAKEAVPKRRSSYSKEKKERRRHSFSIERESKRNSFSSEKESRRSSFSIEKQSRKRWSFFLDKEDLVAEPVEGKQQSEVNIPLKEKAVEVVEPAKTIDEAKVRDNEVEKSKGEEVQQGEERKRRELPDCLLLMMYEPKLSMEVSKETWVCSSDFLRWRPNYISSHKGKVVQAEEGNKDNCNERSDDCIEDKEATPVVPESTIHHPPTPPRPLPPPAAPPSSVSGSEQKLPKSCAAAKAPYEPFVLTRCKSEPLKSSARLAPDWFWKSRHEPIGAAGVGF